MQIDFFSAFIIGLMGSGHCISMCGGITTMLTSALPKEQGSNFKYIFSYNLGRILSYSLIGGIAGFTGSLVVKNIGLPITGLKVIAGIFLILLGLYMGQWLMWLTKIEFIGKKLWQYISPLSQKLIPVNSIQKALFLGGLWGWLPCGLVYSTLTWSLASGSAVNGALIMSCFGLGTLPALLTTSLGIVKIQKLIQHKIVKKVMAILLIIYGCMTLKLAYIELFL